ncbi:hypothetical protein EX895_000730 [Sporisorium graminicola]|uniref:CCHC-type domain-containing protein n=1 Tax=Sporisorium graminicola TaxID=280036 RepID=A0A4U7L5F4_9BASI|nr:hypothetical protein EX895_000730 [Sporisorium graminicola]TKY90732.1 hypothetical protein EX895_000730 [Sporisorium graminicola]
MSASYKYRLLYSQGGKPFMKGEDLYDELETNGIPSGGVRWQFSTRFRPSKSGFRDVLLESILDMCQKHKLTPLEIRHPLTQGGRSFVDVIFAKGEDVLKVYEYEIAFDFYGSKPELVNRAIPVRKHIALCIQTLPALTNLAAVLAAVRANVRIREAGSIVDVWALHCADSGVFKGKVLVLLELTTQNDVVHLKARASIPGWFVFDGVAYLVRFPERPFWCFQCRYDERGSFHSMHTCPHYPCSVCKKKGHAAVNCAKRRAQIAKKKRADASSDDNDDDDDDERPRATSEVGASMERRFAWLGIRGDSVEAEELARDFGVLALSESDIGK